MKQHLPPRPQLLSYSALAVSAICLCLSVASLWGAVPPQLPAAAAVSPVGLVTGRAQAVQPIDATSASLSAELSTGESPVVQASGNCDIHRATAGVTTDVRVYCMDDATTSRTDVSVHSSTQQSGGMATNRSTTGLRIDSLSTSSTSSQ